MGKTTRVRTDEERMQEAFNEYLGKEAKLQNIIAKHGTAPAAVWREYNRAETEYYFLKALWKDNANDPYL